MLFCRDNGSVLLGKKGKLSKTPLRAKSALYDACQTPSGAIIIVGHGGWKGAAYRTVDCKEFRPATLPIEKQLHGVVAMDDGRIIVGGDDDTLLVSYDDGHSFELIDHEFKGASDGHDGNTEQFPRSFGLVTRHRGAVLVTAAFQATLQIE